MSKMVFFRRRATQTFGTEDRRRLLRSQEGERGTPEKRGQENNGGE